MLGEYVFDRLDAALNGGFIVGSAVLAEEVLQHVAWHDGVAFDRFGQVFANDEPSEVLIDFLIEGSHWE